ncbi:hypothetical protein GCM10007383_10530 [Arenibacter certesii]|uniref:Phospholipid/glycerol acyltransferase domain-containing protein n=2 Tax=Arenibacter certesii TaxID=228955 RepID=A0A918IQG7_9FLAO|nr:hypothetical protein GCM10007383_10530 [Arenibacter certesii]
MWIGVRAALWMYFSKISIKGINQIPKDNPLLFLSNHQNALLDALLVATHSPRKIYFLTRSDVFKNPILRMFFNYLQMIPIYRIRDGKESLKQNEAVFERCSQLLQRGEAILIFPEGNHSLKRKVRPVSKGFTRFLFAALEENPQLDVRLVPLGMNYKDAATFPDLVSLYYGKNIRVLDYYNKQEIKESVTRLKKEVHQELTTLTTHIDNDIEYDKIVSHLEKLGLDFLNPEVANKAVDSYIHTPDPVGPKINTSEIYSIGKVLFNIINFPIYLIWSKVIGPKVGELEFLSTVRFMVFLLCYPLFYFLLTVILAYIFSVNLALSVVVVHILINLIWVKILAPLFSK